MLPVLAPIARLAKHSWALFFRLLNRVRALACNITIPPRQQAKEMLQLKYT